MTNAEKYIDELLDIILRSFGVVKWTGEPRSCRIMNCNDCLFNEFTKDCNAKRLEWLNQEYIESRTGMISREDFNKLKLYNDECYIARDEDGNLYLYVVKPTKSDVKWTTCGEYSATDMTLDLPIISWEDSVPWLVKDLKALLVV